MKKGIILVFTIAVALAACQSDAPMEKIQPSKITEKLGADTLSSLTNSLQVSIEYTKKSNEKRMLSTEEIKKLQHLLLNEQGYIFDRTKKCLFIPEITITFINAVQLKIEVSKLCKQVKFGEGKEAIILDIDPMFDELIAYCHELLNNKTGALDEQN